MDICEQLRKGKETVALRVSGGMHEGSAFAFIKVDVAYVRPDGDGYNNSLAFYGNYYDDKNKFKGLCVGADMDSSKANPFSWSLSIDSMIENQSVSLEKAKEMVKTLTKIERKLQKIEDAEGFAGSFEEYVVRLGRAVGAKAFFAKQGSNIQYKLNSNIGGLRGCVQSVIAENRKLLGFTEAA